MFTTLTFDLPDRTVLNIEVRRALAAGASARDRAQALAHVERMRARGVKPPPNVPMLYPLMPTLVTQATDVGVIGADTTPEVEIVLLRAGGADYLTVGSDHTDRRIEAISALQGKNSCPKVVGKGAWPVSLVLAHWDALVLSSCCAGTVLQQDSVARIMSYDHLVAFVTEHIGDGDDEWVLFSGTVPALAQPPKADATIVLQLLDPVTGYRLEHAYTVHVQEEIFPATP